MKIEKSDSTSIQVNGRIIKFNILREFGIGKDYVSNLEQAPSHYAFIMSLRAAARTQLTELLTIKRDIYSVLYLNEKEDYSSGRPPSNDYVEALVNTDEEYKAALAAYNNMKDTYDTLSDIAEAFKEKIQVLRSLAAFEREELKNS